MVFNFGKSRPMAPPFSGSNITIFFFSFLFLLFTNHGRPQSGRMVCYRKAAFEDSLSPSHPTVCIRQTKHSARITTLPEASTAKRARIAFLVGLAGTYTHALTHTHFVYTSLIPWLLGTLFTFT